MILIGIVEHRHRIHSAASNCREPTLSVKSKASGHRTLLPISDWATAGDLRNVGLLMPESTLYLIDDDAAIIDSVTKWMQMHGVTVRSFASAVEFLAAEETPPPGCIVVDLKMPELSGLELQAKLRERGEQMPLIMISGHGDLDSAVTAFRLGADDFLTKPFDPATLLDKVRQCFDSDQRRVGREKLAARSLQRFDALTRREKQVFELLSQGMVGKEIAHKLGISPRTVEKFRANLMRKMGADSVAELVRAGFTAGLISLDE